MTACLRVLAAVAVASAFLLVLPLASPLGSEGPGDWPTHRHDPANTGYNGQEATLKPPLRLKWKYALGEPTGVAPLVAEGLVYLYAGGKVLTLDARTGALRWTYSPLSPMALP